MIYAMKTMRYFFDTPVVVHKSYFDCVMNATA